MIKKLRKRIILTNMLLIGVVIIGIFAAVNISNYIGSVNTLEHGLNQILEENKFGFNMKNQQDFKKPDLLTGTPDMPVKQLGKRGFEDSPMQITSYVIVELNSEGSIKKHTENNVTIDENDLKACIEIVNQSSERSGQISNYGLMYIKRDDMNGAIIALTSNSTIYSSLQSSLLISLALFVLSMGIIFLISLWLSGLSVKPVKKAWEQQKQFVADASHELKTPLTVILANNNIMMSHQNATVKDERQWLESTEEEAGHMKNLIEQMLFLAKSDAGTNNVQFSEVDFSEIVEGCALNFEPVAFEKEVFISPEINPEIILNGNATQLNQLAHILVDNAVKYADNGTEIKIKLKKKNDTVEFSVNNFGNVIKKEELEHIFDRFYRAEKSRTTKGYGLGLSIAQNIVQSMNGKISAESSEENGTTFTCKFNS